MSILIIIFQGHVEILAYLNLKYKVFKIIKKPSLFSIFKMENYLNV